ncbi:hypothetical protein [Evtepia sp.]|uniref:hypothetical protein n=1 Tax=Evtepia sp. TaxID=2773933 RepID=UPI003F18FE78
MNPRTKKILLFALAVVLILAAVVVWTSYPRTFDQAMGRGFDRDRVTHVTAFFTPLKTGEDSIRIELSPDDPAYEDLLALLDSQEYHPNFDQYSQSMTIGGIFISFIQEDGPWNMYFTGNERMQFLPHTGKDAFYSTPGGEAFQQEILDLLLAQPHTVE